MLDLCWALTTSTGAIVGYVPLRLNRALFTAACSSFTSSRTFHAKIKDNRIRCGAAAPSVNTTE